ncbi:MAG: S8 family peptidase [Bacillus cereus]|nr:S8 family peptidase [Bacillus cereus]
MKEKPISNTQEISENIKLIKAPIIWNKSKKGKGRTIAIIDSGCQIDHPNLKENIIGFQNFTLDDENNPFNVTDYLGHGTHVAGIISSTGKNNQMIGIAPASKLLILKVINKYGVGKYKDLINAIEYAINWKGPQGQKIDIINISLGGNKNDPKLYEMILKAYKLGIIIVVSAGNYGDGNANTNEILYPGYYKEVIQIGAIDQELKIIETSNSNNEIDFVAPGYRILSTYLNSSYTHLSGTSMAAPHVSGGIALILNLLEEIQELNNYEKIYLYLSNLSKPLGYNKNEEGNGLIQLI